MVTEQGKNRGIIGETGSGAKSSIGKNFNRSDSDPHPQVRGRRQGEAIVSGEPSSVVKGPTPADKPDKPQPTSTSKVSPEISSAALTYLRTRQPVKGFEGEGKKKPHDKGSAAERSTESEKIVKTRLQRIQEGEGEMSEDELGDLVATFGNNGAKVTTLLAMRSKVPGKPGPVFGQSRLRNDMTTMQGENPAWPQNVQTPFDYLSSDFERIAIVAKQDIDEKGAWGYQLTPYGEDVAPLAGLLGDLSLRHNISLSHPFGQTGTHTDKTTSPDSESKIRSPHINLQIMRALTESDAPMKAADIGRSTMNEEIVGKHLEYLSGKGVLTYDHTTGHKEYVHYQLAQQPPEGELKHKPYLKTLTSEVLGVLGEHPGEQLSTSKTMKYLEEKFPGKKYYGSNVSGVLSHLETQKYVERGKFSRYTGSEASLSDEQRAFTRELLSILDGFRRGDAEIWERGKTLAGEIASDPQKVSRLMQIARDASSQANPHPREETKGMIESLVQAQPGLSNLELQQLLSKHGINLDLSYIGRLAKDTANKDEPTITIVKEGNINYYHPVEKAEGGDQTAASDVPPSTENVLIDNTRH